MVEPWYRSPEFLAAVAASILIVLLLVYLLRRKQAISRIDSMLGERLAERTRLARDLNDSFLQAVEARKLLADNALSKYNDVAEMRRALEKLSEWLGRATEEGRSALDSSVVQCSRETNWPRHFIARRRNMRHPSQWRLHSRSLPKQKRCIPL